MTRTARWLAALAGTFLLAGSLGSTAQRPGAELPIDTARRISLDADWRFHRGDAPGAEAPAFDDAGWRVLDLPHDWAIEGPFDRRFGPERGALPFFGDGWYRKRFVLPASAKGRHYAVEFDGAMANARAWLNGHELGSRPYGYIGFSFDLTPHLVYGGPNVLAVRLAPKDQSSRWYPGAGLYRHVWLDVTGPVRVARWGTFVSMPVVSAARALVRVRTEVASEHDRAATAVLETMLLDPAGREVARTTAPAASVPAHGLVALDASLEVMVPQLWDVGRGVLYTAVSTLRDGERVLDRYETRFGIRSVEVDPARGFVLNGRPVRLQGVCLHHDLGALGAAVNARAIERQLQVMQAMGANAIRTSHNPPAPELLDAADRLGLLVLDEAFDEWRKTKVANGHGTYFDAWGERDLRDMIRRDRNHPSVVLWSIGNEILEQGDPDGWKLARRLTAIAHEEDPTRKVTAGFNQVDNAIANGLVGEVDVAGFNYAAPQYAAIARAHPEWVILGAETASTVSSRGVYHLPVEKYKKHPSRQITSYDIIAPPWAYAPDIEFAALDALPGAIGEFVWTGFDYLGEPTPYWMWNEPVDDNDWPARSSYFGIVDLAGFPKDRYYLYQSRWTSAPMVHLLPHWNWAGREGQAIPVFVYTNAEEVELLLNGRSLGTQARGKATVAIPVGPREDKSGSIRTPYRMAWSVPWEPGTLRAVARTGGRDVAAKDVRTAGPPARVVLQADRTRLRGIDDLAFVTVRIEDAQGTLVPGAETLVRFSISGPGRIAAVDNGNPASLEPFQATQRTTFGGLALAIVRGTRGAAGAVRLEATAEGLQPASLSLEVDAR